MQQTTIRRAVGRGGPSAHALSRPLRTLAAAAGATLALAGPASAQTVPESLDLKLVGHSDLQGRPAYQPTIHRQGERWIAYVGHHGGAAGGHHGGAGAGLLNPLTKTRESSGTSILDVTDPHRPTYLSHIPGPAGTSEGGGAQMTRVCDGKTLPKGDPGKVYLLRSAGDAAHELYDVTNPARPSLVTRIGGLVGTHKSWWECDSGIAYLVSGTPGWRKGEMPPYPPLNLMTKIYDLSDPAHPVFLRDFGLAGQQPGATGPVPPPLHGMVSTGPRGNRIYFAYGIARMGVLQIVDRDKLLNGPKEPTAENLNYPEVSRLVMPSYAGIHTAFPLLDVTIPEFAANKEPKVFDFVALPGESAENECNEPRQMVRFADITDEKRPVGASSWTVSEASGNFCSRGGRFGPHATNENFTSLFYNKLLFVSYFNAGVRAIDVRDPFNPREVAYYIPSTTAATEKRCTTVNGSERCKRATQTNNVEVDERGYIYIVDRAGTGMHILELTGKAKAIIDPGS